MFFAKKDPKYLKSCETVVWEPEVYLKMVIEKIGRYSHMGAITHDTFLWTLNTFE